MAKRKRKAYVVTKGRQTGIFETWDEAEPLVKGFSGAKYQGYNSLDEAERAWRADQAAPAFTFTTAAGRVAAPPIVRAGAAPPFPRGAAAARGVDIDGGAAPPPPPVPSIKTMKAAILAAGLGVADLIEKRDVVERYQQALTRTSFRSAFVPASAPDPVAAAARAAAVPVRPSNPRPAEAPEWAQHTSGFGIDMMRKQGYAGGGLGANGRAVPVEAVQRPRGVGLGFDGADARAIELTEEQEKVCSVAMGGHSLFFTGNAGTGKTTTMRALITRLIKRCRSTGSGKVFVTASTGAAAVLCRGTTLHSFAGVDLGKESAERLVAKLSRAARKRWRQCSTLVIDEISMIDGSLLDKIDAVGRAARGTSKSFGGVQVVVSGDFMQLPPVNATGYAFDAEVWPTAFGANQFCLTRVFRQRDASFVSLLNELRVGRASPATCATLQATAARGLEAVNGVEPTKLFARNAQVDAMNRRRLSELRGEATTLRARDEGDARRIESCSYPAELVVKVGAQVMLLKNLDMKRKLINGSRGVVVSIIRGARGGVESIHCNFARGGDYNVTREDATVEEAGKVLASRTQFPLRLAWALSIHKSQGQTIDLLDCDLQGCFEDGQAYTAVSRATDLEHLVVRNFSPGVVRASAKCLAFDERLRRGDAPAAEEEDDDIMDLTADEPAAPPPPSAPASGWNFAEGRRPPPQQAATLPTGAPDCLAGKVFVTTGVLPTLDRDQIKAIATKCGGRCTGAVSSKTTHLIAGDVLDDGRPVAESGKYKKAAALGAAIISEAEFRAMVR